MRQRAPFGDRSVDVGSAEHRPHVLPRQRQSGGDDEQRNVLGKCLSNTGKRVLDAGAGLRGEHAVALAALDARIAVRQADADALLPAQDRTDVERRAGLDQRIARVAGEEICTLAPENFGDDRGSIHGVPPCRRGIVPCLHIGCPGSRAQPPASCEFWWF
jgi:hypothetical protein